MKQLITFFVLACLISWLIWLPLYQHIFGWQGLPVLPYHHALGGLGPCIAAFLLTTFRQGKTGVRVLLQSSLRFRPLTYLMIALLGPFALALFAVSIRSMQGIHAAQVGAWFQNTEFPGFNFTVLFLYNLLFFGLGEEVGWRGFALPRLQGRYNAGKSALLLTACWALWHLPLFAYRSGYNSMDFAGIAGWLFSLLTGSVLLTWLFNSSGGSILICAIFHATVDIVFTSELAASGLVNYLGFLITTWGLLTWIFFRPGNLATRERIVQQDG